MQGIYFILGCHAVYAALVKPSDLIYPSTFLLFILSLEEERVFLLFILTPAYMLLSEAFRGKVHFIHHNVFQ
jgi:hypothetical protein